MTRALIALLTVLLGTSPLFAIGSVLVVTQVSEAGSVFVPPAGTVSRYVTSLGPDLTFYESRLASGFPSGLILKAPDLSGPLPVSAAPATPLFFESDGVTPFCSATLYHPRLIDTPTGLGLYVIDALPEGTVYFFHSTDLGMSWVNQGPITVAPHVTATGLLGTIEFPDPSTSTGTGIRIYYQGDGTSQGLTSRSLPGGSGLDLYTQHSSVGPAIPGVMSGFTPTGGAFALPDGRVGLFFVPQDDSYLGFAESPDGLEWTITRGADAPILSTSANAAFPDPARDEITEVSLIATANGLTGYFVGAMPGQGPESRSVGSLTIEFRAEFLRGDCNLNTLLNIGDVFCQLGYLFFETAVLCRDANDTNDDGVLDLADPVALVQFLFAGGAPIPEPFLSCGEDPTPDALTCFDMPQNCP